MLTHNRVVRDNTCNIILITKGLDCNPNVWMKRTLYKYMYNICRLHGGIHLWGSFIQEEPFVLCSLMFYPNYLHP